MPREEWAFLIDPLMEAMAGFDFNGRQLDVRENVAFQGRGEQTRFIHERYPGRDWILTRILWLSGREPGRNRLGDVDTMRRYIYIHGCPDSAELGRPTSSRQMKNCDPFVFGPALAMAKSPLRSNEGPSAGTSSSNW